MTQTLELRPSKWDNESGREVLEAPDPGLTPSREGLGMEPTPKKVCAVEDCHKPVHGRGWCNAHYRRWTKDGTTDLLRPAHGNRHPWPERFWDKVDKTGDCWLWTAYRQKSGYGRIGMPDGVGPDEAHRVAWELIVGPIPDGLEVDHMCFVRACVNPAHLRLLTPEENSANTRTALATYCSEGHEYTRHPQTGKKLCKPCMAQKSKEKYEKRRLAKQQERQRWEDEIRAISGKRRSEIAEMYGISLATVGRIRRGDVQVEQR